MLDPAFTIPVKLPVKSVEAILTKPVPIPPDTLIVPSLNELKVTVPVPLMFKKSIADYILPRASLPLELTAITAPRPVALPCSRSTILCIVKFLVGFPCTIYICT